MNADPIALWFEDLERELAAGRHARAALRQLAAADVRIEKAIDPERVRIEIEIRSLSAPGRREAALELPTRRYLVLASARLARIWIDLAINQASEELRVHRRTIGTLLEEEP